MKDLTEEYLLKNGWHKWGRDDMPSTISFEKHGVQICSRDYYKNGKVFGFSCDKKEENNSLSWEPLIELKTIKELKIFENLLTTKHYV